MAQLRSATLLASSSERHRLLFAMFPRWWLEKKNSKTIILYVQQYLARTEYTAGWYVWIKDKMRMHVFASSYRAWCGPPDKEQTTRCCLLRRPTRSSNYSVGNAVLLPWSVYTYYTRIIHVKSREIADDTCHDVKSTTTSTTDQHNRRVYVCTCVLFRYISPGSTWCPVSYFRTVLPFWG